MPDFLFPPSWCNKWFPLDMSAFVLAMELLVDLPFLYDTCFLSSIAIDTSKHFFSVKQIVNTIVVHLGKYFGVQLALFCSQASTVSGHHKYRPNTISTLPAVTICVQGKLLTEIPNIFWIISTYQSYDFEYTCRKDDLSDRKEI